MSRLNPMSAFPASAMATALEGQWTGSVIAEVPPNGGALYTLFLEAGSCALGYAIAPPVTVASENDCATLCLANSACQFFSFGLGTTVGDPAANWYCTTFPFCIGESAANYTTFRIFPTADMVGAQCSAELSIRGLVVDLSVHSCGDGESVTGVRRSPQAGALRGILLAAPGGPDIVDATAACNALAASSSPCQGMQYPLGLPAQPFPYWRLQIRWTGSSRDRTTGDVDNVLLATDLSDGAEKWPLQIAMCPITDGEPDPTTSFDLDFGGGVSGSFPLQPASRFRFRPAAALPLLPGYDTDVIGLLSKAYSCSAALDGVLDLALTSTDCGNAVSAFFPSMAAVVMAKDSAGNSSSAGRILLAKAACGNPCLSSLAAAVRAASETCTDAWHSAPLADAVARLADDGTPVLAGFNPGVQILLTNLLRVTDAKYLLDVACATNWRGTSCTRGPEDLPSSCPTLKPGGSAVDSAADQTLMLPVGADGCGDNCSAELASYIYIEGCCSATIANAQVNWMDAVARLPALAPWFWVDWGDSRPVELFRPSDACPSPAAAGAGTVEMGAAATAMEEAVVGIECRAALCGLTAAWPSACCNTALCSNGGTKVHMLGSCDPA